MGRFWWPADVRWRLLISAALLAVPVVTAAADDPRLAASRSLVDDFADDLRGALGAAIANGGPLAAVEVCRDQAPLIASRLARVSGARIGRTSLRLRNPGNAPEPWQQRALWQFRDSSRPDQPAEHFETDGAGGFRYLRAIHTGGPCLVCHGDQIDPAVAQRLDLDYPHDRARGYQAGELRGAFSVSWPAEIRDPDSAQTQQE